MPARFGKLPFKYLSKTHGYFDHASSNTKKNLARMTGGEAGNYTFPAKIIRALLTHIFEKVRTMPSTKADQLSK